MRRKRLEAALLGLWCPLERDRQGHRESSIVHQLNILNIWHAFIIFVKSLWHFNVFYSPQPTGYLIFPLFSGVVVKTISFSKHLEQFLLLCFLQYYLSLWCLLQQEL